MAKVAILGFGTVGSGVLEVMQRNEKKISRRLGEALSVKYVCDIRDFSSHPNAALFVKDLDIILNDEEVRVVVETIGGTKPALDFVKRALQSGRHVVTSNKELVATHGTDLIAMAKENNVCFLFEASVGGGTPVITPLHQCLAANNILSIAGIVNGTTNFMLTCMEHSQLTFDAALKQAQDLGYAETIDPSSDVDGIDACRKIAILASIAYGKHVHPQNIATRGIRSITPAEMGAARKLGCAVKLIAWAKQGGNGQLAIGVEPMMVPRASQLAGVEDVFNAVAFEGDMLGETVFYGKGAGKLPTASAVVADVIDAAKDGAGIHNSLFWEAAPAIEGEYPDTSVYDYYLRAENAESVKQLAASAGAKMLENGALVLLQVTPQALQATMQDWAAKGCKVATYLKFWPLSK